MNRVIGNLISNAIKFTPVGKSVKITARKIMPDVHCSYSSEQVNNANNSRTPSLEICKLREWCSSSVWACGRSINRFKSPQTSDKDVAYDIEGGGSINTHSGNNTQRSPSGNNANNGNDSPRYGYNSKTSGRSGTLFSLT